MVATTMTPPAVLALHLAANVHTIARHESAGQCFNDIRNAVDAIDRMINRPKPPRMLGPCRAPQNHTHDKHCPQPHHPHPCGIALTAKLEDTETTCPTCGNTYNIERLLRQQIDDTNQMSFTLSELFKTILPIRCEYIPLRTLQHWAASGKLVPTGYNNENEPRYLLADVRDLRDAKPQNRATGATAHKKPA